MLCKFLSEEFVVSANLDYRGQWCFGVVNENIHRSQRLHPVGSHTGQHEKAVATLTKLCDNQTAGRQSINFIRLALNTKNVTFNKVIKMDGDMVVLLKNDQIDASSNKRNLQEAV